MTRRAGAGPGGGGAPAGSPRREAPLGVLVVDDSASVRAVLRRFFSWTDDIRVVGEADEGGEAVREAVRLAPDVILMDLMMPGMDGYAAIAEIMRRRPTPILVLSTKANRDQVHTAFEALKRGALEVLPKPEDAEAWRHLATTLPEVVRSVAGRLPQGAAAGAASVPGEGARRGDGGDAPRGRHGAAGRGAHRPGRPVRPGAAETGAGDEDEEAGERPWAGELRWVAIGASTGGPSAVCDLLAALPPRPPVSVLVVQHISPGFELGLVDWLAGELDLDVRLARDGEAPPPGAVRLAPPDHHLRLDRAGVLRLDRDTPPWRGHRPSVDELLFSCARHAAERTAGVLLTGMGTDGVQGLVQLAAAGGLTVVQDEASAVVYGMPRAARERGAARRELPPREIGRYLARHFPRVPFR